MTKGQILDYLEQIKTWETDNDTALITNEAAINSFKEKYKKEIDAIVKDYRNLKKKFFYFKDGEQEMRFFPDIPCYSPVYLPGFECKDWHPVRDKFRSEEI